jgi:hypothetical protein
MTTHPFGRVFLALACGCTCPITNRARYRTELIAGYSNTDLKNFFVALFDAYLAPMGLTRGSVACGYACSDHASWTNADYPAAMMFEAGGPNGSFPYIHTPSDTLATNGTTDVA